MSAEYRAPLAQRMRPTVLDEVAGQKHLIGESGILRRVIDSGNIGNMIFFGPPGVGKTTVANIAAEAAGKRLYRLNGTTASTSDVRDIIAGLDQLTGSGGAVVYLDEIQYFNKKQQQTLLSYLEDGRIILIASTVENPFFYVYPALLSRCTVFEFKPLSVGEILQNINRAARFWSEENSVRVAFEDGAPEMIARAGGGDMRRSLNCFELAAQMSEEADGTLTVTREAVSSASQCAPIFHDRDGDSHYDLLSAFQKSIRGSDADAAVYYLARLLEGGDLPGVCRRLMVTAAEDIGLAYPNALAVTDAAVDMAFRLGLPEARIPLADAVIMLATAPKSNSGIRAVDAAAGDIRTGRGGSVPEHLRDSHYRGSETLGRGRDYKYPHSHPGHYVPQQYLPDALRDAVYYEFGDNRTEQAAKAYMERLKGGPQRVNGAGAPREAADGRTEAEQRENQAGGIRRTEMGKTGV